MRDAKDSLKGAYGKIWFIPAEERRTASLTSTTAIAASIAGCRDASPLG